MSGTHATKQRHTENKKLTADLDTRTLSVVLLTLVLSGSIIGAGVAWGAGGFIAAVAISLSSAFCTAIAARGGRS